MTREPHSSARDTRAESGLIHRIWTCVRLSARTSPRKGALQVQREPAPTAAAETPAERRMQQRLSALLDRHPPTRSILRHLAMVEQSLKYPRAQPLDDTPHEHLTIALRQLERLVSDWRDDALSALRATLREHIADRVREEFGTFLPVLADFVSESRLMVADTTMSSFVSAGEWLDERSRHPDATRARAATRRSRSIS